MIIVFIGPPYAGKDTQGRLLSQEFGNMPIFSMGHLIREARESGNETFIKAYDAYALKGFHLPTAIKFPLLKEKMDQARDGFILDNFPATKDDLVMLNNYLLQANKKINKVIYIDISEEEMRKRFKNAFRGRKDDDPDIVATRREIQNQDRVPVLEFYKSQNLLSEINGEEDIDKIHKEILEKLQ
ncbi:MAG: nucleoside monophosphate kinase [Candidatus Levybacteria bacterium]|nr:nucleoside monophosphate kinase [Candidatus Levybacteria bacterium]